MTLTIHKEEDEQRQLLLTVTVDAARVDKAMRQKAKKLARDYNFPGFRKGKAPYQVIANRIGWESLRAEVAEEMAPAIFEETMADVNEAEIYGQPTLSHMELDPLAFTFTIPLRPVVTLGAYRSLRQDVEPVVISDKAVNEALEHIRDKYQELEQVERPLALGDMATLSGVGKLVVAAAAVGDEIEAPPEEPASEEGEADRIIFAEERIDLPMDPDRVFAQTPFVENLLGLAVGDETTFNFTFPDHYDNEELAGKEVTFTLMLLNVQARRRPDLDDALAQQEGAYETLDDLRAATYKNLLEAAATRAKNDLIETMADKLTADATIVYPPAAIDLEIEQMVDNLKTQAQRSGWEWEHFLRIQGINEEEMRKTFREPAAERLTRRFVIQQFIADEKIRVNAADIDTAVAKQIESFDDETLRNTMRDYYRSEAGLDVIGSEIVHNKVYDRIQAIFGGYAPELSALQDEETANDEEE